MILVERLCHEVLFAKREEESAGVRHLGTTQEQGRPLRCVQGSEPRLIGLAIKEMGREVDEMAAVGEEHRPAMTELLLLQVKRC